MSSRRVVLAMTIGFAGCFADSGPPASETYGEIETSCSTRSVVLCHIPPGDPENAHTIEVSPSAVRAHLQHGDYLGPCEVCVPGTVESCYPGPAETAGVGICVAGTQTCNAAGTAFGECTGAVVPSAEVCGDALDNNCDGVTDETCVCIPNSVESCYPGPAGTEGVGVCRAGTRTCSADGSGFGECTGAIVPTVESCSDSLDSDCDGSISDGDECDIQPPTITITAGPANGDVTHSINEHFEFVIDEPGQICWKLDGNQPRTCSVFGATSFSATFTFLTIGTHTLQVDAMDLVANMGSISVTWTIVIP